LNWKQFVLDNFPGGLDLGTFNVRNIRGGNSLSVHAVGRAWDWRFENPGPGRETADAVIELAIANFEALGIQAIHDYVKCRIWRCNRGNGPGWKQQKPGNGMGAAWAGWPHFEVHPDSALHTSTVNEVLAGLGTPVTDAPPEQTAELPQPTLADDSIGAEVVLLQQVLAFWGYYTARVDGRYGALTAKAVTAWQEDLQSFNVGRPDGRYGPRTHAAAALSYAALADMAATPKAA
jgi:hypothetical protein